MKINEFASAADTLALWKTISDNTWAVVAQQAEAEARAKAERAAAQPALPASLPNTRLKATSAPRA